MPVDFLQTFFSYDPGSLEHRTLLVVVVIILVLLVFSVLFAMLAISLRITNTLREKKMQHLVSGWESAVLDVLSEDMDVSEFHSRVRPGEELSFIRFLAPYAYKLKGSYRDMASALARPYLSYCLPLLEHKDPGIRAWAVNTINLFGMPGYENEIKRALLDDSSVVAMFAANSLLEQQKVAYVEPILRQLYKFDQWNTSSLSSLLAKIGNDAVPVLRKVFLDESVTPRTRIVTAEVLKKFNDFAVADDTVCLLQREKNPELVAACLRLLAGVGQEKHLGIVRQLCLSDNEIIRVNAIKTLRQLSSDEDRALLRRAIEDSFPWVAIQAAWALKELGDMAFLEELIRTGHPKAMLARQVLVGH